MKKLMILVSCFSLLFVLSNVSFAQEVEVADFDPVCSCPLSAVAPAPLPFVYPPYPAPKFFGHRLAAIVAKRTVPFGTPYPGVPMGPVAAPYPSVPMGPVAAPYPYGVTDLKHRAIRRAARLAPRPQPYPVPVPVAVAPPAVPAPEAAVAGTGPVVQTGRRNLQRYGDAPVINFMSIVRTPPQPYYYPMPVPAQPQQ